MCENDQYPHMIQSYTPFWTVITHGMDIGTFLNPPGDEVTCR